MEREGPVHAGGQTVDPSVAPLGWGSWCVLLSSGPCVISPQPQTINLERRGSHTRNPTPAHLVLLIKNRGRTMPLGESRGIYTSKCLNNSGEEKESEKQS